MPHYTIKEMFYTLQGEGANTGRASVFCRFSGCNLWTGREQHRESAVCQFCDTDFVGFDGPGGGRFLSAEAVAEAVAACWPTTHSAKLAPLVVCTGGEPLLQLESTLVDAFHKKGFEVAIETNGTLPAPEGIDWVCVSPKADAGLTLSKGHELKLVYPQSNALPEQFESLDFEHFYLQPMDGEQLTENTTKAIAYCMEHPQWRLSLQTHKLLGIP